MHTALVASAWLKRDGNTGSELETHAREATRATATCAVHRVRRLPFPKRWQRDTGNVRAPGRTASRAQKVCAGSRTTSVASRESREEEPAAVLLRRAMTSRALRARVRHEVAKGAPRLCPRP